MMDNEFDIFDDDGEMAMPTMRGSANLDVQDYQGWNGHSDILDDDLQEDTPSTPGRNPGAAAATDIEGTSDFDMLEVPGGMDAPGMKQTDFGDSPWGPGSETGYRPYSQQRTGMDLRALGGEEEFMPTPQMKERDSMHMEPEVIDAVGVAEVEPWSKEWHGQRNQQPSNAEIDPMTIYDRTSFEYDSSSQDTIGSGIFGMEEGVTWRPRDGSFANNYAYPAYIADEDELGVQQSEMWDSTAGEWRVTQPSASGVALARKVKSLRPSPFGPMPQMRPDVTGPRSHVEAFGRMAAKCVIREAQAHQPGNRGRFLANAMEALGPGATDRAKRAADRLMAMGYRQDIAFEDALAHLIMHATAKDLTEKKKRTATLLPRLDRMSKQVVHRSGDLRQAANSHLAPIASNGDALRKDLGALFASPAGQALGTVSEEAVAPETETPSGGGSVFSTRNMLIAGGVGLGAYVLYANRKTIKKNLKKIMK